MLRFLADSRARRQPNAEGSRGRGKAAAPWSLQMPATPSSSSSCSSGRKASTKNALQVTKVLAEAGLLNGAASLKVTSSKLLGAMEEIRTIARGVRAKATIADPAPTEERAATSPSAADLGEVTALERECVLAEGRSGIEAAVAARAGGDVEACGQLLHEAFERIALLRRPSLGAQPSPDGEEESAKTEAAVVEQSGLDPATPEAAVAAPGQDGGVIDAAQEAAMAAEDEDDGAPRTPTRKRSGRSLGAMDTPGAVKCRRFRRSSARAGGSREDLDDDSDNEAL